MSVEWDELCGAKDWAGLFVPGVGGQATISAHPQLVKEIVKYGELAEATYDGFVDKKESKYLGRNVYTRDELLDKSLPENSSTRAENYVVEKYLHSTSGFSSLYGKDNILSKLYKAVNEDKPTPRNIWAGYVAYKVVDSQPDNKAEIEIVVVFRGTKLPTEWISDAGVKQVPWLGFGTAKVHHGFQEIYRDDPALAANAEEMYKKYTVEAMTDDAPGSPQQEVHETILKLAETYKIRNILSVGHSLGAALATVCALDIGQFVRAHPDGKKAFPSESDWPLVTGFVYASPRVGNGQFKDLFATYGVKFIRITTIPDVVTKGPGGWDADDVAVMERSFKDHVTGALAWLLNSVLGNEWAEVGTEIKVDYRKCSIVKNKPVDVWRWHNLETYLHLVVTQLGGQKEAVAGQEPGPQERHHKLCNKLRDMLLPEFGENADPPYPAAWWSNRPDKGSGIPNPSIEDS